ncbi:hypothetical protein NDU88_000662 [Pleurodeles waltl]|uniref:Uncharacterized protein n=1 Tax=Pleurodeles waltl TaxID=8319 RepID=A0AAV7MSH7_PLEWA|nr:hypothetical protein NDU88_000662 [Pleurodeles waltl]
MGTLESHMNTVQDRDQDLLYLRSKIKRPGRQKPKRQCSFLWDPGKRGESGRLRSILPKLTALTFDLPLEFQWVHQLGLRRPDRASRPRPIIACLVRHGQARQLLQAAQTHRPFWMEGYYICIMADYSKDTNKRRKAFLAPIPV